MRYFTEFYRVLSAPRIERVGLKRQERGSEKKKKREGKLKKKTSEKKRGFLGPRKSSSLTRRSPPDLISDKIDRSKWFFSIYFSFVFARFFSVSPSTALGLFSSFRSDFVCVFIFFCSLLSFFLVGWSLGHVKWNGKKILIGNWMLI